MKKLFVLVLCSYFIMLSAVAQEKESKVEADSIFRINEISLVVTDLIDGSYQFRYERKFNEHISIGLGTAIKTKEGLINISGIDRERLKTGDITYSGIKLIPDVRYYLNKTQQYQLDGFYFGAYAKYFHFTSNINGMYISSKPREYTIDMDAKINILSLGLLVGYKLALNSRFTIDFLILGPGTSHHKYKLYNHTELPEEFYEDLNQALQNLSLYDLVESDFRFDFKDRRTEFSTISFRYGLTIGYTF
ncbi:DUF3575 domain-containing protein [uncultured Draconibacterium sp.]|uniref:DUF3575 domain-containing protein n=1 Tax=uncultured Draconibacterium sp. TaxID=1573823 RepID=UPI002AA8FDBC|nr:DUF3575 domain-containing protein [uncultured Draconibacterium sp.]